MERAAEFRILYYLIMLLFLQDPSGRAFTRREKIFYVLTAVFFISLFLPDMPVIVNLILAAYLPFLFFSMTTRDKLEVLWRRKEIFFMVLFFLLHIVSALLSVNQPEAWHMVILRLPLLVFPVSMGVYRVRREVRDRVLLAYSVIITLTAIACLIYAITQARFYHDTGFLYDDSLSHLVRRQSVYVALMVNIALFSYGYLLSRGVIVTRTGWVLVIAAMLFLAVFHFMLASRISIITLYSGLVLYLLYGMVRSGGHWLRWALPILGLGVLGVVVIKFAPKTLNRFRELNYTEYHFDSHAVESHYNMQLTPDQWNGANLRLAIWKCGWELAGRHPLFGTPLGDKEDQLVAVFRERQFDFAAERRRNMHNTYLDVLCNFGVIGVIVFLLGYILLPLLSCYRFGDGLGAFIALAFAAAMVTETWPDKSVGCMLLAFFLSFLASARGEEGAAAAKNEKTTAQALSRM